MVTDGSNKRVWWLGKCGHELEAPVLKRSNGADCPYCINKKVLPGYNDLATIDPEVTLQWHPTKNGDLTPQMVTAGSHKKVWWLGSCGHEWIASVYNRTFNKSSCPYCAGKKAILDYNDLTITEPELAAQWHSTKNGALLPQHITRGSRKKVWWQCERGHEWFASVKTRSRGNGCPFCSGVLPIPGETDLFSVNPFLANEWHLEKNGELTPAQISYGSGKKVWWICSACGHEWETSVNSRTQGSGCPNCSGQQVIPGETDLVTTHPGVAAEWHPVKNGMLAPDMVTAKSSKKVWWKCDKGHEWKAMISSRVRGSGCPYCANRTPYYKKYTT